MPRSLHLARSREQTYHFVRVFFGNTRDEIWATVARQIQLGARYGSRCIKMRPRCAVPGRLYLRVTHNVLVLRGGGDAPPCLDVVPGRLELRGKQDPLLEADRRAVGERLEEGRDVLR